ncbi:MAG TPA: HyaD/HybD family hydrogenase maturation endopeptidase [Gemmatimonadales bacterium]|nr:HyaD/HybD family hydrogenase maturation endopeptidase [Gemmatimonadales bacterium]
MSTNKRRVVVIGLGNTIMGDDGLGLVVLEYLQTAYGFPPEVELVDGGTWGMNLLPVIEDAAELILIDAIDAGVPPGTFVRLEHDRLPRYLATKISPHQVDLRDVLALAELRGTLPPDTVALGLQPASIEMRHSLSEIVRSTVPELAEQVVQELARRGHLVEGFLLERAHA